MEIKTKFDYGDPVVVINENKIVDGKVCYIGVKVTKPNVILESYDIEADGSKIIKGRRAGEVYIDRDDLVKNG